MYSIKLMLCITTILLKVSVTKGLILDGEISTDKKVQFRTSMRVLECGLRPVETDAFYINKTTCGWYIWLSSYDLPFIFQGLEIPGSILFSAIAGEDDLSFCVSRSKMCSAFLRCYR